MRTGPMTPRLLPYTPERDVYRLLGVVDRKGATATTGAWPNWYADLIEIVGGVRVLQRLGSRITAIL